MQCPVCGGAELVHDTRNIPCTYKGKSTIAPGVAGDFCPACGEVILDRQQGDRYSEVRGQFCRAVDASAVAGQQPSKCPVCGGLSLVYATRDIPYAYKGETITIEAVVAEFCDACGESITGLAETCRVMRVMATFKDQCDAHCGSNDDR